MHVESLPNSTFGSVRIVRTGREIFPFGESALTGSSNDFFWVFFATYNLKLNWTGNFNVDHEVDEPTEEGSVIVTQFSKGE